MSSQTLKYSVLENGLQALQEGVLDSLAPEYDHEQDSGMRLYVLETVYLYPFVPTLIPHGISIEPPKNHHTYITPRSSTLMKKNIHVALGTIDYPYRGELKSCVTWIKPETDDREFIVLEKGQRVSQLVCQPITFVTLEKVLETESTSRGDGGFGSTGA